MNRVLSLLCLLPLWGCSQFGILERVAPLPRFINECSGMYSYNGQTFWVLEDGGNAPRLRELDTLGTIIRTLEIDQAENEDWEALTADSLGNLYIGDFGNNKNDRRDLAIYRIPNPATVEGEHATAETIRFHYPDQKAFPPKKDGLFYDAEALFHQNGFLYVVTKNRARPSDGVARVYRIPDRPGSYAAELVGQLRLCDDPRTCQVTDAALSPDGSRLALLGYGKLWVYETSALGGPGTPEGRQTELRANTQLEAVCFANDSLLYLADERSLGRGGNLYRLPLPRPE